MSHLSSLKLNTLKLDQLEENVYHFHIDGRPGDTTYINKRDKSTGKVTKLIKNKTQKIMTRMLWSVGPSVSKSDTDVYSTVYLKPTLHPHEPFTGVKHFHRYMSENFPEKGLSEGNSRPLYKATPDQVHRLKFGDVMIHSDHCERGESQIIHAEPNPYPKKHRWALIWDFKNNVVYKDKKVTMNISFPEGRMVEFMSKIGSKSPRQTVMKRIKKATTVLINLCENDPITKFDVCNLALLRM
jgi:hypothetical protein